jgi:mannose-6-phosphate isomerase-like protein (cupin superfamily)
MTDRITTGRSQAKPGAVLRRLRMQRGWTLSDVSRRTGLPVSTLSKVENDISRLFGGAEEIEEAPSPSTGRRSITRAGEGKAIETANYGHLYPAADLLNKRIVPIMAEVRVRKLEDFGELIRHPGEEFAFVVEGEVELHTELYAPVRLKAGDSIYFDSGMGHAYINVGKGTCRVLSVCSGVETQLIEASRGRERGGKDESDPPKKLKVNRA